VRILAKHTRYAAEAAAPVIGKPATAFAKAIAAVQTVLGDHQDACVMEGWLRQLGSKTRSTKEAMVVGQLIGPPHPTPTPAIRSDASLSIRVSTVRQRPSASACGGRGVAIRS